MKLDIKKHGILLILIIALICVFVFKSKDEESVYVSSKQTSVMEVYLLHQNHLIMVPTSTASEKEEEKMQEIVAYMKQSVASFDRLLDEKTQLENATIKEHTMILNFATLSYDKMRELRLLEALLYSSTQFDDVETLEIHVANERLMSMPVNQTPIPTTLNRDFGINHMDNNQIYMHQGNHVTLFYEITVDDKKYTVPKSIKVHKVDDYQEVFQTMVKNISASTMLKQPLAKYKITSYQDCELKKDVLHLYLNKQVLDKNKTIKKDILEAFKQNLKQFKEIKFLTIHVNDKVISIDGKNKIKLS